MFFMKNEFKANAYNGQNTFTIDKNQESGAPGKIISTESPVEHKLTQGWYESSAGGCSIDN